MNPTLWVAVIEWASDDGDIEPVIILATTEARAKRSTVEMLVATWATRPGMFHDDAPEFMKSDFGLALAGGVDAMDDATIDSWLESFHDATTAPWATIKEKAVEGL